MTSRTAVTFCSFELEPETSNMTVLLSLSYVISILSTLTLESEPQSVKPVVFKRSSANEPVNNVAAVRSVLHEAIPIVGEAMAVLSRLL